MKDSQIISKNSLPIIIPHHRTQDIDTEEDLLIAKLKFNFGSYMKGAAIN